MHINGIHRLETDEGENFKVCFDPTSQINPNPQAPERILIVHAPPIVAEPHKALAKAANILNPRPVKPGMFYRSTHLIVDRNGRDMVQMVPFQLGSNNAAFPYSKRSIGIDLVYTGELDEKKLKNSPTPVPYLLGSGMGNSSRFGYWPLFPREQLDALLQAAKTIMAHNQNQYHIVDVVTYDEIVSSSEPGPAFPIIQFREKLLGVSNRSFVLQEIARSVRLLGEPGDENTLLSALQLPKGTPVSVINERFDWYLVSVVAEIAGNPWRMGWVEKDAVRVKTDFTADVNESHYLTADGRRFQEIVPHPNGYEQRPRNPVPEFIIMHYTTGTRMESTINTFKDPSSGVSTHLLIGRDGRVVQFLPFDRIAHHSGYSWWEQRKYLNTCSIGIELDNAGMLIHKDGQWQRRKIIVPDNEVLRKIHKHQYDSRKPETYPGWQTFTDVQLKVAFNIVQALVRKYPIKEILGHDDVNIRNRYDPGPLFEDTMKEWRKTLLGREEPIVKEYLINHETEIYGNFQGRLPNPKQRTFDLPLPAKSLVKVLREDGEFSLVTVIQTKERKAKGTGWIKTSALVEAQTSKKGKAGKRKNKNLEDKRRTTVSQLLFRRGENSPTPRLSQGPFEVGTRVRIQERRGQWTLVVLIDRYRNQGGLEGWLPSEFISPRDEIPALAPAVVRADPLIASIPLWQHKDDGGTLGSVRDCAPCPAVFTLHDSRVTVTKEWQFFIRAINPDMPIRHVVALFDPHKAFTNRASEDRRANHLQGRNLDCPALEFDKVRTCALSVLSGEVVEDMLRVEMLDGSQPPPLKPGRSQPQSVEEINLDDYLFTPRTHRHLFFAANIVRPNRRVIPFPRGAQHAWTNDGNTYTWLPHVSRFEVLYPLSKLMQLPPGAPVPVPYK